MNVVSVRKLFLRSMVKTINIKLTEKPLESEPSESMFSCLLNLKKRAIVRFHAFA